MLKGKDILKRLQSVLGVSSLAELGRRLDIAPQALSRAVRTGKVPDVWLYKAAYETGRSIEWLRTGKGEEFQHGVLAESRTPYEILPPGPRRDLAHHLLEEYLARAPEDELASLQRLVAALESAAPDVRSHLVHQLELLERLMRYDKEHLAARHRRRRPGGSTPADQAAG